MRMTDTRRSRREALNCEIDFKRHGDARYQVEMFNLSPHGCCLSPPTRVSAGDRLGVRIGGLSAIHGEIAWVNEWKAGVRFHCPFHSAVFENVVKRLARA